MLLCRSTLGLLALLSLLHPAPGQPAGQDAFSTSGELDAFGSLAGRGLPHRSGSGASRAHAVGGNAQLRVSASDAASLPSYGVGADWEEKVDAAPWEKREGFACLRAGAVVVLMGGRMHDGDAITYMKDVWTSTDGVSWVISSSPPATRS